MVHYFEDLYYVAIVHSKPFIRTVCIIVACKHNHMIELNGTFQCRYGIYTALKICLQIVYSISPGGIVSG